MYQCSFIINQLILDDPLLISCQLESDLVGPSSHTALYCSIFLR